MKANDQSFAKQDLNRFRASITSKDRTTPTLSQIQGFCINTTYGDMKGKIQAANCGELALLAVAYVRDEKKHPAAMCNILGANHMFCVVGPACLFSLGKTYPLKPNFSDWPNQWAICDPWANIACLPNTYMQEFEKKMKKWESDSKRIYSGSAWILPTNKEWVIGIRKNKKELCLTTNQN